MSDKLQKTSTEISLAVDIADAIERSLPADDKPAEIGVRRDRWPDSRCIGDQDRTAGVHVCPGVITRTGFVYYCKCSCNNCLTAERKVQLSSLVRMYQIAPCEPFTNESTCLTCSQDEPHTTCTVVYAVMGTPLVCMCDCIDCKRLWFSDGRPVVRNGKIVRTTPETINRNK